MNSVALPASATAGSALGAEGDLVRQALRGDHEAFSELYRRHSAPAWRLAQAVAPGRDAAIEACADGFVRALRSVRWSRRDNGGVLRNSVLAEVYRVAFDRSAEATPSIGSRAGTAAALSEAAFRSLPERWRAALWLSEVENFDSERIATVLGVSGAVAAQLVLRGRRGLTSRFNQARQEVPESFSTLLRPLALDMPLTLAEAAQRRWAAATTERAPLLAPAAAWLEDRALRPMSVAVGALLGLGLIGLGVVPQTSPVRGAIGSTGGRDLAGALPVQTCYGISCPTGGPGGAVVPPGQFSGSATLAGLTSSSGTGGAAGTLATGSGLAGSASPATGAGTPTSGSGGAGTPANGSSNSPGGGTNNPGQGGNNPSPSSIVSTPVVAVSSLGSTYSITLLPAVNGGSTVQVNCPGTSGCTQPAGTTNPVAKVTSGVTGAVSSTVGGVTGSSSSTAASPSAPATVSGAVSGVVAPATSTATTAVSGVAGTVTSTVTTLVPGL